MRLLRSGESWALRHGLTLQSSLVLGQVLFRDLLGPSELQVHGNLLLAERAEVDTVEEGVALEILNVGRTETFLRFLHKEARNEVTSGLGLPFSKS